MQTLTRPNTCDLFEVPATPSAKRISACPDSSEKQTSPDASLAKKAAGCEDEDAKKAATKRHHAKYMRFYRSLESHCPNIELQSCSIYVAVEFIALVWLSKVPAALRRSMYLVPTSRHEPAMALQACETSEGLAFAVLPC